MTKVEEMTKEQLVTAIKKLSREFTQLQEKIKLEREGYQYLRELYAEEKELSKGLMDIAKGLATTRRYYE